MIDGDRDLPSPLVVTRYRVSLGERELAVALIERRDGLFVSVDDGPEQAVEILERDPDGVLTALIGGEVLRGLVGETDTGRVVVCEGEAVDAVVLDERAARLASATGRSGSQAADTAVRAPMPGLVVAVNVAPGQAVAKGTTIVVLSAMKMQNELTARADATVKDVLVTPGQTVDQNQVLVTLE